MQEFVRRIFLFWWLLESRLLLLILLREVLLGRLESFGNRLICFRGQILRWKRNGIILRHCHIPHKVRLIFFDAFKILQSSDRLVCKGARGFCWGITLQCQRGLFKHLGIFLWYSSRWRLIYLIFVTILIWSLFDDLTFSIATLFNKFYWAHYILGKFLEGDSNLDAINLALLDLIIQLSCFECLCIF